MLPLDISLESGQSIIEATTSMAICFALPTLHTQREALSNDETNITSGRMLHVASYYGNITKDDDKLMTSVLRAAALQEWTA